MPKARAATTSCKTEEKMWLREGQDNDVMHSYFPFYNFVKYQILTYIKKKKLIIIKGRESEVTTFGP